MATYLAAIDQGTTSTRCIVFNRDGRIVGSAHKEHAQLLPRPGWVEHDALEIWRNTIEVVVEAKARAGVAAADLAALGITNQRETTVLWNRQTGLPLHNALVWQDTRTDRWSTDLPSRRRPDRYRDKTGLPLATYFSGLKLRWMLDNVAGARAQGRGRRRALRHHRYLAASGISPAACTAACTSPTSPTPAAPC